MLSSNFKEAKEGYIILENMEIPVFLAIMDYLVSDKLEFDPQISFDMLCHVKKIKKYKGRNKK